MGPKICASNAGFERPREGDEVATHGSETEIKLRVGHVPTVTERLSAAGFVVSRDRVFEANTIYDTPAGEIRAGGCLLRLREAGQASVITYKGPAREGKHKSREELETTIGSGPIAKLIFERLGFVAGFRYEKFRTEFGRPGEPGVVTLDETPVGWFIELEGDGPWIDRTAAELGFSEDDYVTQSYGALYLQHCESEGVEPANMVFSGKS